MIFPTLKKSDLSKYGEYEIVHEKTSHAVCGGQIGPHVVARPLGGCHLHRTVKKSLLIDVLEC